MTSIPQQPCIYVLAGVNGAGKSSIAGATFRREGSEYYNPDEIARRLRAGQPMRSQSDANAAAWREGVRLLKRAIEERLDFALETTLGGATVTNLLSQAASLGIELYVWYVGLESVELHIERVQARVRKGGHHIPEENIRRRYESSPLNLIKLLPGLTALRVFDNSEDADPAIGKIPSPRLVLEVERGKIVDSDFSETPDWAKPIRAAALKTYPRISSLRVD